MKTLFISFDKDFPLYTEGNIVVLKHDLLNDLFYELGSEMTFLSKSELSTDKNALIADFKNDCPEEFKTFSQDLLKIATKRLLEEDFKSESRIRVDLPETYIEWLKYHPNPEYHTIGRMGNLLYIDITTEDLSEYVTKFLNTVVKKAIETDLSIEKFTFVEAINDDANYIKQISSLRDNLTYEPYDGYWVQCEVAAAYCNGIGAPKNILESFKYYIRATEKGNGIAANWLGWCYQTGNEIEKDEIKAFEYYKKGSDLGNVNADANVGYCYHLGIGTPVDYEQAVKYYLKGAEAGIAFAQVNLANIYYDGLLGTPNYEEAFKWYSEGAKNNNAHAQYKVGEMLCEGTGVTIDIPRGLDLLKKSAIGGNTNAVLLYAHKICKSSDLNAIQEALELLDNCEKGKRFPERNPEIFYVKGKILYDYFSSDDTYDAVHELEYAKELGYKPASKLIEEIEKKEEEKHAQAEQHFTDRMESLMKKAVYSDDEKKFLNGEVSEDELEGCTHFPPKEWEQQFIISDKYGVKYNQQYHRLISGDKSRFNPFRLKREIGEEIATHYDVRYGTQIICSGAFLSCRIQTISLPDTLKVIGSVPAMISNLTIPQSVDEIYVEAFGPSSAIQTVTILNGNIRIIWEGYDGDGEPSVNENNYTSDDLLSRCDYLKRILIPKGYRARFASLFPSVADKLEEFDPASFKQTQDAVQQAENRYKLEEERLEEKRRHNKEMEKMEQQKLELLRQRQISEEAFHERQTEDEMVRVIIYYKLHTWRGNILDNCNMIRNISHSTYNSLLAGGRAAVISFVQGEKGFMRDGEYVCDASMTIL